MRQGKDFEINTGIDMHSDVTLNHRFKLHGNTLGMSSIP